MITDRHLHRARYAEFVAAMVYGEKAEFDDAMRTVADLAGRGLA